MGGLYSFNSYIKESFTYRMGANVFVNGIIDSKTFNNTPGYIADRISNSINMTNMNKDGFCEPYSFMGDGYEVEFEDGDSWWCPVWNLSKERKNEISTRTRWYKKGEWYQD